MMAKIKPFRGVLYNPRLAGDISKAVSPPYDVISPEMQEEYYRLHNNNVVRLILGNVRPSDNKAYNRYTRARRFFDDWLKKGILIQDKTPSIYIYRQEYLYDGSLKSRLGFIALMEIEDPHKSRVLPHEYTFSKPKKDRFELIKATRANLSPIFSLFEDKGLRVTKVLNDNIRTKPIINIEHDGVRHVVWRLGKPSTIRTIANLMKPKQIFIADGHHRYEVALMYRDQMRKKAQSAKRRAQNRGYDYVMMYFSNLNTGNLTILSTHRVIKSVKKMPFEKVVSKLKEFFIVEKTGDDKEEMLARITKSAGNRFAFGMYYKNKGFFSLTLKSAASLDDIIMQDRRYDWRWLDVTILHRLVFDHILKVKERVAKRENIVYTRDADYAKRLVDEEDYMIAFFLKPPRLEQVRDVARSHQRMPHKTTYFYPKPLSGLVFHKMENI